ncbi:DUF4249 domain-containing protein [Flavobacterium orientale]|uniref:DUF4249 domain-containing protein n=1 Tax=Flavobacterium orientale TaxID=1756020 RepID=A0A917DDK1_9FLAO|nr:DUF4249 domain-containing protein [Flavobacterium orientale]GGD31362.1 hypothetical protein GCM10011343_21910 [Flavobacterium orientale]
MKKIQIVLFSFLLIAFSSCEEVIDVNLQTAPPRLVVEASINWIKETPGNIQVIRLSTTTGYFNNEIPAVSNAFVTVTNSLGTVFNFIEIEQPGLYVCTNFIPVVDEIYTLTIEHEGQIYTSTERLLATPSVTRIEQQNDAGPLANATEVKFFFNDIPDETNFYFLSILDPYKVIPEYGVLEDRFFQNNEMFGLYFSDEFKPNDTVTFAMSGVSQQYYNYMNILLAQVGTTSAGPFSTPTSTVRGNIVNQTEFENFALGYFRLGETEVKEYVIQ